MELTPARKTPYETGHGFDPEHPGKPVVVQGGPDDADSTEVVYYGSVLAVDGEYRMWYGGAGTDNIRRVCYAVSKDGIEWDKPKLGILEYGGNKNNNLVGLVGDGDAKMIPAEHLAVLYEPDDPDPKRRYKMVLRRQFRGGVCGLLGGRPALGGLTAQSNHSRLPARARWPRSLRRLLLHERPGFRHPPSHQGCP